MSVWINTKIQATIRCNPHLAKDGGFFMSLIGIER